MSWCLTTQELNNYDLRNPHSYDESYATCDHSTLGPAFNGVDFFKCNQPVLDLVVRAEALFTRKVTQNEGVCMFLNCLCPLELCSNMSIRLWNGANYSTG